MSINQLKRFAYECVTHYAVFDKLIKQYVIEVDDLPDFIQHEFASKIMSDDEYKANESTGSDNRQYCSYMLPSLIKFLNNSTSKDEEIEFVKSWRDGVTEYHKDYMHELLEEACFDYNESNDLLYFDNPVKVRENIKELQICLP